MRAARWRMRDAAAWRRSLHVGATLASPLTVREALAAAQQRLARQRGEDERVSARTDAKALLADALHPRLAYSSDVIFHLDRQLTHEEAAAMEVATTRRLRGEPLAYVLGRAEFWSMGLSVSSDTLIPRADSEVLIETLATLYPSDTCLDILDIGTGSGCLLLAALREFPNARGVGVDVSRGALRVASENARRHGLEARATLLCRDLADLAQGQRLRQGEQAVPERFDVVVCNPPYIPSRELSLVAPDVLEYEPHLALFSDPAAVARQLRRRRDGTDLDERDDGLQMYRLLLEALPSLLKPTSGVKRSVLVEVGSKAQAEAVRALFASSRCAPSLDFERSEFLLDGRSRHRGVLLQTRAS